MQELKRYIGDKKPRHLLLKQCDKNTKFFHKMANAHKRYNCIAKIKVDGRTIEDKRLNKEHILRFYDKLLTENETWTPLWEVAALSDEESRWLQRQFIKQCCQGKKTLKSTSKSIKALSARNSYIYGL